MDKFPENYECEGQIDIWEWMEEKETQSMTREEVEKVMGTEPKIQASFELVGNYVKFNINGNERIVSVDRLMTSFPEPSEEAISRQAVLDKKFLAYSWCGEGIEAVAVEDIESLPNVQPKPKMGRWIRGCTVITGDGLADSYNCSECGDYVYHRTNYCPNCGKRMLESEGK